MSTVNNSVVVLGINCELTDYNLIMAAYVAPAIRLAPQHHDITNLHNGACNFVGRLVLLSVYFTFLLYEMEPWNSSVYSQSACYCTYGNRDLYSIKQFHHLM